jgi:hypothetical protein
MIVVSIQDLEPGSEKVLFRKGPVVGIIPKLTNIAPIEAMKIQKN